MTALEKKVVSNAEYIDSILTEVLTKAEFICVWRTNETVEKIDSKPASEFQPLPAKNCPALYNKLLDSPKRRQINQCITLELPQIHTSCRHKLDGAIIAELQSVENSEEEEIIIFDRYPMLKRKFFAQKACQTSKLHLKKLSPLARNCSQQEQRGRAPCERTKQTLFIEAVAFPTPSILSRAPLLDRFCYMLTDFATALYCSLAIMCCCTPNMFSAS